MVESKAKTRWDGSAFGGTKIALLCGDDIVAYLRDDKPEIPFPGMWDLPGGGPEGDESPIECGIREVSEEFCLTLNAADVVLVERNQSATSGLGNYFCAVKISQADVANIRFGDEGQRWKMMPVADFVNHEAAVPHLRNTARMLDNSKGRNNLELQTWVKISPKAPPTLIIHAMNDSVDDIRQPMAYALALNDAGVAVDMRLYAKGGHAFGMRPTGDPITTDWPEQVKQWLRNIGVL